MRIERVRFQGMRGLKPIHIDFPSEGPTVITGSPGCGKTTVLEAIIAVKEAKAPYGQMPRGTDWPGDHARLALDWRLDPDEQSAELSASHGMCWEPRDPAQGLDENADARMFFSQYVRGSERAKVEYFHAPRDLDVLVASRLGADSSIKTTRLQTGARKYAWLRSFLEQQGVENAAELQDRIQSRGLVFATRPTVDRMQGFARNLAALSPRLRWLGLRSGGGTVASMFARSNGADVELAQLTWSERMVVLFAATYEALGLHRSVLLVDLPELALHPSDQTSFFQALCALSPRAQVIAATQSPAILRSLGKDQVGVLDDA